MELIKKQTKYLLVLHSLFLFEEINRQLIAEVFARDDCAVSYTHLNSGVSQFSLRVSSIVIFTTYFFYNLCR